LSVVIYELASVMLLSSGLSPTYALGSSMTLLMCGVPQLRVCSWPDLVCPLYCRPHLAVCYMHVKHG